MRTVLMRLRAFFTWLHGAARSPAAPADPPADAEEHRAFDVYILRIAHPAYLRLLVLVFIVTLLWWPIDFLTEGDNPARQSAFTWARGLIIAASGIGALLLAKSPPGKRTYTIFCAALFVGHVILGGVMATLPAVSGLQFFYTLPLLAIVVPMPLPRRFAFVGSLVCGFWIAAIAIGSQPLEVIGAPAAFSVGAGFASVLFGHWLEMLLRTSHVHKLRLDALTRTLEDRVAEQSEELRALARSVVDARDSERAMLSRELHDAMGQELTAIRYGVAFVERRVHEAPGPLPPGLGFAVGQLSDLLSRLNDTTKRLLLWMRPREVEQLGLGRALVSLVEEARTQAAMNVALDADLDTLVDVEARAADVAFRAIQEGLANARRHAPRATVRVGVARVGEILSLRVEDDGAGAAPSPGTGLGLVGIRERAASISGHARWGPRPGGGFALCAEIPHHPPEVPP